VAVDSPVVDPAFEVETPPEEVMGREELLEKLVSDVLGPEFVVPLLVTADGFEPPSLDVVCARLEMLEVVVVSELLGAEEPSNVELEINVERTVALIEAVGLESIVFVVPVLFPSFESVVVSEVLSGLVEVSEKLLEGMVEEEVLREEIGSGPDDSGV
jgi:hypothetical protein